MKGFEVMSGLSNIEGLLNRINAKSLYEKELIESYKNCLHVAMGVVAAENSSELGGFYDGHPIIKTIEKVLGISLMSWQKEYILRLSDTLPKTRGCGKTLAYQLRMIASPSLCFDLSRQQDLKRMSDTPYITRYLVDEFVKIHKKLADVGMPVCKIIRK